MRIDSHQVIDLCVGVHQYFFKFSRARRGSKQGETRLESDITAAQHSPTGVMDSSSWGLMRAIVLL
jgi:hypothetical protein